MIGVVWIVAIVGLALLIPGQIEVSSLRQENARLLKLANDQDATIKNQDEALKGAMSAMENMQDAMETQGEALKRATAAMDDSTVTLRKANSTLSTCRAIVEGTPMTTTEKSVTIFALISLALFLSWLGDRGAAK